MTSREKGMHVAFPRASRRLGRLWPAQSIIAALILGLSFLLVGCGSGAQITQGAAAVRGADQRQIIVLWHSFTGPEANALDTLTDRFNADNPWNIVLVTEFQSDVLDKLLADPEQRPDLLTVWPKDLQAYAALGMVGAVPSESPEMRQAWGDFLPMAQSLYRVDGVPQALPIGLATYLAYTNADWLADLGYDPGRATWEDLRRTACAATDPLRGQVGVGIPARSSIFLGFLAASGSQVVGADGYYQFADAAGHGTASLLQSVLGVNCGALYEDREIGVSRLGKSSMAMIFESSEYLPEIERAILSGRNFQLSLDPLPGPDGPGPTLWYGPGLMVSAPDSERQDAALKVMSWFLAPEAQRYWGETTEFVPVRRSVLQSALDEAGVATSVSTEDRLWQLTLDAADSGAWVAWPQATNRITCRASLLRGLLALQDEEADANAYVDTAVTACNTGVGFQLPPTSAPSETTTPVVSTPQATPAP